MTDDEAEKAYDALDRLNRETSLRKAEALGAKA